MLNKYKYSLNRGLKINSMNTKKGININTYGIVCQSSPILYDVAINEQGNMVILYNDHEYLHRGCTFASDSNNQQMLNQISKHYISQHNNLTIFVANQPLKSQSIVMGFQNNSLLYQSYSNLHKNKQESSKIGFSIIGVKNENILTDQLDSSMQLDSGNPLQSIRHNLRIRNVQSWSQKYGLQNLTKKYIEDERSLQEAIIEYKQKKNAQEYMSLGGYKQEWDWLQAQLFIINQYGFEDGVQNVIKCHYILKVNQYLLTTSSLMLKIGIALRKLQQRARGAQSNESKLFKMLSNCWIRPKSLNTIHLFLQIGHQLTLKEEYLNLVPTSDVVGSNQHDKQLEQIAFFYIKNYQNYPKITSFISKLNKQNEKAQRLQTSVRAYSNRLIDWGKVRSKSYAKDTLSSIQKKRVNNILEEFEQSEALQTKNLQSIIQEAASLYKQPNPSFRLSYHKQSNIQALKKHKKFIQTLNATNPSNLFHSERMKSQYQVKHTIVGRPVNKKVKNNYQIFQMYTKNRRRARNFRKERVNEVQSVGKQVIEVQKGQDIMLFDQDNDRFF